MSNEYKLKLIELAREVRELQKEGVKDDNKIISIDMKRLKFLEKLNYLIGYILALEEVRDE